MGASFVHKGATVTSIVAILALVLGACMNEPSDGDGNPKLNPTPKDSTDSVVYPANRYGTFALTMAPSSDVNTSLSGLVYDAENPMALGWKRQAEAGVCTLYLPKQTFCDPGCGSSALCVEDGVCKPYANSVSVGQAKLSGLNFESGKSEVDLYVLRNKYQFPAGTKVQYPPFAEGDTLTLTAAGDTGMPAFSLPILGIAPLITPADTVFLELGKPIELSWTPPAIQGNSRVTVTVDISHHGGIKGKVECETEDTGHLTVDADLLSQLHALGVAGWPKIDMTRKATSTLKGTYLDFSLVSSRTLDLKIPGVVSCEVDEDCPSGQTCQGDLQCK